MPELPIFRPDFTLENDVVLLRPLRVSDLGELREIAFDPEIWRFFTGEIASEADLEAFVEEAIQARRNQARAAFATVDKASGRIAGSTSYANVSLPDRRLEIGWSWLAPARQRTGLNRNAKYLQVKYAIEELGFERVEFKTDVLNTAARRGLLGIGCTEEGVLRSHTQMPRGRRRDTIYYSILRPEWEAIRQTVFAGYSG